MAKATGSMFRIGLLMDHPSPHMLGLLTALAEREDCAAEVIYLRPGAPERSWGDPPGDLPFDIAAPSKRSSAVLNIPAVLAAMSHRRVDIWVVNTCYTTPETWAAVAWLNAARRRWVYMNEPLRPRGRADALKRRLLQTLLKGASGVIGAGDEAKARYAELAGGVPSASVPYYVDLADFLRLEPRQDRPAGSPVRFLFVGQMIHRKGLDLLLAACRSLPETGWTLTLVGEGPLRAQLERAARERWGPDQVRFVGQIPYDDRVAAFAGHDVFVFPSRWDGWGMAPVEAMAAGLPVISTDQVMSAREFVRDGQNGYLVRLDEAPAALADRMRRFIDDPAMIHQMGAAARAALADYRGEVGAARLVDFLARIHAPTALAAVTSATGATEPPTWRNLTEPAGAAAQLRARARATAKRSVIDLAEALRPGSRLGQGDRILVYHLVLPEDRKTFDEHLAFLRDHYRLVTTEELVRSSAAPSDMPRAAITFDDGFRVLMRDALDVLQKHGAKATFYVPTGFVGMRPGSTDASDFSLRAHYYRRPLEPMTVDDLRDLKALGHEVGSHGVSHVSLGAVSRALAARELMESRKDLERWLGAAPCGFAYPYGDFASSLGDASAWVSDAGYGYAVTLKRGAVRAGANRMTLPRDHAEGNWRVADLRYFLSR